MNSLEASFRQQNILIFCACAAFLHLHSLCSHCSNFKSITSITFPPNSLFIPSVFGKWVISGPWAHYITPVNKPRALAVF